MEIRETWYIVDSEWSIINDGEGFEDRYDAIQDFKCRYTEEEARKNGYKLCKIQEDDEHWYECVEEWTVDDIY